MLLPELLFFLFFLAVKGTDVQLRNCQIVEYTQDFALSYPIIYCVLMILEAALEAVVYSGFCMISAIFIKNRFIAIAIPFVIYIVTYLNFWGTKWYWLTGYFLYDIDNTQKEFFFIRPFIAVGMIIICLGIFIWGNLYEEKN